MIKLTYNKELYQPHLVGSELGLSYAEAKSEYNRLQRIVNEKLAKMSKGPKWIQKTKLYSQNINQFNAPVETLSNRQLAYHLFAMVRFARDKRSSVYGMKKARAAYIEKMHEHGYGFINSRNLDKFYTLMDKVASDLELSQYSSGEIVKAIEDIVMGAGKNFTNITIDDIKKKLNEY